MPSTKPRVKVLVTQILQRTTVLEVDETDEQSPIDSALLEAAGIQPADWEYTGKPISEVGCVLEEPNTAEVTFYQMFDGYTKLLEQNPGKALVLGNNEVALMQDDALLCATLSDDSARAVYVGHFDPRGWEDEENAAEVLAAPTFMDVEQIDFRSVCDGEKPCDESTAPSIPPVRQWSEFNHNGQRWSFDSDELALWNEDEEQFEFYNFHGLEEPSVEAVVAFIEQCAPAPVHSRDEVVPTVVS